METDINKPVLSKKTYEALKTEITASMIMFGPEDDYKKGHNDAMKKALNTIRLYSEGKGLFQI